MNEAQKKTALRIAWAVIATGGGRGEVTLPKTIVLGKFTIPEGTPAQISGQNVASRPVTKGREAPPYTIITFFLSERSVSVRNDGLVTARKLSSGRRGTGSGIFTSGRRPNGSRVA